MRLTTRSEYGLLALVYLARRQDEGEIPAQMIARDQDIPLKFLEQILLTLKMAQYLKSTRGSHGGYKLARSPGLINLAEVIRLLDGPLAPTRSVSLNYYAPTPVEKERKLIDVFIEIRDHLVTKLENTTLADIA